MAITGSWEDHEQIRELYSRYAYTIDLGRSEEWVNCFTADGVFDSPLLGRHAGHDGLRRFTAIYRESAAGAQVRHVMSNLTFEINGDRAKGGCYLTYYHCKGGKATLQAVGRYEDELAKANGAWLYKRRQVFIDGHM